LWVIESFTGRIPVHALSVSGRTKSQVNHGLLLPILLHCRDDQEQPLLGPPQSGRETRRAYADIPPAVEAHPPVLNADPLRPRPLITANVGPHTRLWSREEDQVLRTLEHKACRVNRSVPYTGLPRLIEGPLPGAMAQSSKSDLQGSEAQYANVLNVVG